MKYEKLCRDCEFSDMNGNPVRPKRICTRFPENPACVNARQEFRTVNGNVIERDCGPKAKLHERKNEYRNQPRP